MWLFEYIWPTSGESSQDADASESSAITTAEPRATASRESIGPLLDMGIEQDLAEWAFLREQGDIAAATTLASAANARELMKGEMQDAGAGDRPHEQESESTSVPVVLSGEPRSAANAGKDQAWSEHHRLTQALGMRGAFVPWKRLVHLPSEALWLAWVNKGRGLQPALPEYKRATEQVCLDPVLMSTSYRARRLGHLAKHMWERGTQETSPQAFEALVLVAVRKAFALPSDAAAREYTCEVGDLASGRMFEGAMQIYHQLGWERHFLAQALCMLNEQEDADGLQVILGMLRSGADNCYARKHYVFNAIVSRLDIPVVDNSGGGWSPTPGVSEQVAAAQRKVFEVATEMTEDMKDLAFKSTFLEPTKVFFRRMDDPTLENQVDVHGANTYLALLAATLGIELARRPLLDDAAIGVADFLATDINEAVDLIWDEDHFGQDWENLGELRPRFQVQREAGAWEAIGAVIGNAFFGGFREVFIFKGLQAKVLANAAVNPNGRQEKRRQLARYLEKFTSYFREDFILPRLISRITSEEGESTMSGTGALQTLMDDLVAKGFQEPGDVGEEDVRFWLWDMSELPGKLRTPRAKSLLQHAGVMKPT